METRFIEAIGTRNWGKFMLGRFTRQEWSYRSRLGLDRSLLSQLGWDPRHLLVLDLHTCEGAVFRPGGCPSSDLEMHPIHVCPMFQPFLEWLYEQDLTDLSHLPEVVQLLDTPGALYGHRRPGPKHEEEGCSANANG